MNNAMKLLIPLIIGGIAGGINFWVMSSMTAEETAEEHVYIQIAEDVKAGESFTSAEEFKTTQKIPSALRWEERHVLKGMKSPRNLKKGDLLLQRDILPRQRLDLNPDEEIGVHLSLEDVKYEPSLLTVGKQIGVVVPVLPNAPAEGGSKSPAPRLGTQFRRIGPLRVVSVGRIIEPTPGGQFADGDVDRGTQTVTVAVPKGDGKTFSRELNRLIEANRNDEISAIVFYE